MRAVVRAALTEIDKLSDWAVTVVKSGRRVLVTVARTKPATDLPTKPGTAKTDVLPTKAVTAKSSPLPTEALFGTDGSPV
jgi:hypothetical protein